MALDSLGIHVNIHRTPCELVDPISFDQNEVHRSCDPEFVTALSVPKRPSGAEPGNRDNLRENLVPLDARVADLQTYRLITIEYTSDRMCVQLRTNPLDDLRKQTTRYLRILLRQTIAPTYVLSR